MNTTTQPNPQPNPAPAWTPGPWAVDDGCDSIDNMVACLKADEKTDREWIAVGIEDHDGYAESVAYCHPRNARLIAAAPEMAEALAAIVARINGEWDNPALLKWGALHPNAERDIEANARALLARLNGEGGGV